MRKLFLIVFSIVYSFFFCIFDINAQVVTYSSYINYPSNPRNFDLNGIRQVNVPLYDSAGYQTKPFNNAGQGYLIFSLYFECTSNGGCDPIVEVNANTIDSSFICEYETSTWYGDNTTQYTVITPKCPVNFSYNNGLESVTLIRNGQRGQIWGRLGERATMVVDTSSTTVNVDNSQVTNAVNNSTQEIKQQIQSQTNSINGIHSDTSDIKNAITDDSVSDSSSATSGFSSSANSGMSNTPVSGLITLPITFLTGVSNAISSSCTNINYIELYNYQLVLPCLNLSERLGNVWVIIDTIFSCMLIFSIGKSLVRTFARLSDMDTNIMYECYANGKSHRGDGD